MFVRSRSSLLVRRHLDTTRIAISPFSTTYWRQGPKRAVKRQEPRVILDEYGIERRPLPPLGLDGKEKPIPASPTVGTLSSERSVQGEHSTEGTAKAPARARRQVRRVSTSRKKPKEPVETENGDEDGREMVASETNGEDSAPVAALSRTEMTDLEALIRGNLERYPDALLLTQVGSFYESYFEQAKVVAKTLGIKLTSKPTKNGRQAFAGFPLAQLGKQVSVLVQAGHKVVIVEEFKEIGTSKIKTSRRVSRVVTPGTGVDEAFVALDQSNFVLALGIEDGTSLRNEIGLAYRDISTGASFTRTSKLSALRDDIRLVQPKEIVVDKRLQGSKLGDRILELLEGERAREGIMVSTASTDAVPSTSKDIPTAAANAENVLLSYLATTLVSTPVPSTSTTHIDAASVMHMDAVTLQSLEIRESLRGGVRGSLLGTVKRTVTPGGRRLLTERLCNPSTDLDVINARLDLITVFLERMPETRPYLRTILRSLEDTPRLLQRLAMRRPSAAWDLLGLKRTMRALEDIRRECDRAIPATATRASQLGWTSAEMRAVRKLLERLGEYSELATQIEDAVDEEALTRRAEEEERKLALSDEMGESAIVRENEEVARTLPAEGLWGEDQPWVIRPHFSSTLAELHGSLTSLRKKAAQLQHDLRERYKSPALTLRNHIKFGAGVHIKVKDGVALFDADPSVHAVLRTNSTRLYVVKDWSSLFRKITSTQEKIREFEAQAMQVLVARLLEHYTSLGRTADGLAELDVAMSFAELAYDHDWVRPVVDASRTLCIEGGRHPTVEQALAAQNRQFHANSLTMHHPGDATATPSFVHVLTGPNMAGKSTFLRQTAIIAVLAQAGAYVPADSAHIGVLDRLYSRVGARDELDRDRSTFMIEMDEATTILDGATDRSLVLLDELGRGTSPIDGLAIAYAALEHLTHANRSRTLFATHYHRLGQLLDYREDNARGTGEWEGVEFWCTDVEESEDTVRYLHAIRRGLNNDSAGLVVARLAGMPTRAILTARRIREQVLSGAI
ncbi:hypothetical protein JCM10908_001079 [Rhodotorula pacifica]|uniref:mismatch repair ATPase MSH1 n=1 Tax=Rhodotorula pacifica TaxID=1495444 RepID=UPI003178825C